MWWQGRGGLCWLDHNDLVWLKRKTAAADTLKWAVMPFQHCLACWHVHGAVVDGAGQHAERHVVGPSVGVPARVDDGAAAATDRVGQRIGCPAELKRWGQGLSGAKPLPNSKTEAEAMARASGAQLQLRVQAGST